MKRAPKPTKRERAAAQPAPESERYTIRLGGADVVVPYVAAWSSEEPNFRVAPEPLLGGQKALFRGSGRRGEGKPVLGKMDPGRQRYCILRRRCQVCAAPMGTPFMVLLAEQIEVPGMGRVWAVREPAACASCLATSLLICPGLKQAPWLRVVIPSRITTVSTITTPPIGGFGPLTEDGPELVEPRPKPVIGYLKVIVHEVAGLWAAPDFIDLHRRGLL